MASPNPTGSSIGAWEKDVHREQLYLRFAQLENFASESRRRQEELQTQIAELTRALQASTKQTQEAPARQHSPPIPKPQTKDLKTATPDMFTGNRSKLQAFLTQLKITFFLSPNKFNDDRKKVLYTISLLRDQALNWIKPLLRAEQKGQLVAELQSFEALSTALERMFGDVDAQATAERKLEKLRQTTSARAYMLEFRQAASHLTWGNEALTYKFYIGLKDSVKDRIAEQGRPSELGELMQLAVQIDDRLYKRLLERKATESSRDKQHHRAL